MVPTRFVKELCMLTPLYDYFRIKQSWDVTSSVLANYPKQFRKRTSQTGTPKPEIELNNIPRQENEQHLS